MSRATLLVVLGLLAAPLRAQEPVMETLTFEQAVARALERNPSVGEAQQAIAAAQARLDQARSVFYPSVDGTVGTVVLDEARGFNGQITQPRRQTALGATVEYAALAAPAGAAHD